MSIKKALPIDISSFDRLRSGGYLYVDKTQVIHHLITSGRFYFLARPRRFGKSLLISTLRELFLGNKEYFKDLWIDRHSSYEWPVHPVINLDFSALDWATVETLSASLGEHIESIGQRSGVDVSAGATAVAKLYTLVKALAVKGDVVLLIDEYDAPIVKHLENPEVAEEMRTYLSNFYTTVKGLENSLRFLLLTGVSKFSKASVFSGLNNLRDISMLPLASAVCGYTEEELHENLAPHVAELAHEQGRTSEEVFHEMRVWYNGYRFSRGPVKVYNPFSVFYYLNEKRLSNYWFSTGTPDFLIGLIKKEISAFEVIDHVQVSEATLGAFSLGSIPLPTILLQTGYLTIEDYDDAAQRYQLSYPNQEVRISFAEYLVATFLEVQRDSVDRFQDGLRRALRSRDVVAFCEVLQSIFSNIPYQIHVKEEAYYHSLLQVVGLMIGLDCRSEISMSTGRIDLILTTSTAVYIFELKLNRTPQEALHQIQEKRYYEPYSTTGKQIVLVGLNFNFEQKKLSFLAEPLKETL